MDEEIIEVPIQLDKKTMDVFIKLTKKELIERMCALALEAHVAKARCKTAIEDSDRETARAKELEESLTKAESFVEQGRAMINAITDRWYHYD